MTSPAERHMMRVSASETARRAAAPLRNATAYEQMLVKLAADNRTLKQIRSNERKADKKRELLPFYLPWVAGVLANGKGGQDDIIMTVMLWRLDADDIAGALEIARYAMTYGLTMPTGRRPTPYLLAEEVALAAQRLRGAKQPVELANLLDILALTERADMPDIVRAKLHKITGYVLRDAEQLPEALAHLQRAIQLESSIGVRKDIEQLERQLRPKPEPAPKTQKSKPRTRKVAEKPAARRGRPPKAAKAAG
ncbi:TPA: terminase endonuclease subunit [Enterobacter cloacae]|nr:terminase endonuclease subunit [Enterobacter cloacae]